jgi:hypothetical protein
MDANQIFSIVNTVALLSWIVLAVLPGRQWVAGLLTAMVVPALLATAYAALILTQWRGAEGGFGSLPEVETLFTNPWLLLAGWIHYLAFDLIVGSWEARDSRAQGIPHVLLLPCLALTFMFGPMGWLLYVAMRAIYVSRARGAAAAVAV